MHPQWGLVVLKNRTQRIGGGCYKLYRKDGLMFTVQLSRRTLQWRVYRCPEAWRDSEPETPPEWFIDEFQTFSEAQDAFFKGEYKNWSPDHDQKKSVIDVSLVPVIAC